MKKEKDKFPKLPRFSCPKDMKSKIFRTKKEKANQRKELNRICNYAED